MPTQPPLVIYGNGQMARMLHEFMRHDFHVAAFTVDAHAIGEGMALLDGLPVLPFETLESPFSPDRCQMIMAVGHVQMNRLRAARYLQAKARGYRFINYIHPSVVRHASVEWGENNVVLDHVAVHPFSRIGNGNFICSNASIGHGCRIDDDCLINSGVSIAGETHIQSGCFLGANATVADNITVGDHCYIGANTLVAKSTGAGQTVISAPGERFPMGSDDFLTFTRRRPATPASPAIP